MLHRIVGASSQVPDPFVSQRAAAATTHDPLFTATDVVGVLGLEGRGQAGCLSPVFVSANGR